MGLEAQPYLVNASTSMSALSLSLLSCKMGRKHLSYSLGGILAACWAVWEALSPQPGSQQVLFRWKFLLSYVCDLPSALSSLLPAQ